MGAYSIYLLVGLVAMSHGPAAWDAWLSFGRHPVGLFFALLCLAATLLHAITWFKLSASVFKMNFKGRPLPKILMVCFQAALAIVLFGALSIVFWQVWR
jgi:fumarate reductase subunit C